MLRPQHVEQKQPYVDDSCKLLLHFNGQSGNQQFIDSSNSPKVVTAYGNACLSSSHYRFGGTSAYFDGDGDYLSIPDSSDWYFGTDNFTILVWTFPTSMAASTYDIISQYQDGNNKIRLYFYYTGSVYYINLLVTSGGSDLIIVSGIISSPLNKWNQYIIIRNGTSFVIYENGVSVATLTDTDSIPDFSVPILIGGSATFGFIGFIDELIIWKGIAKPIGELYPQTRPYGYPIGGT